MDETGDAGHDQGHGGRQRVPAQVEGDPQVAGDEPLVAPQDLAALLAEGDSSSNRAATATAKASSSQSGDQPARARRRWPNSTLTANPARAGPGRPDQSGGADMAVQVPLSRLTSSSKSMTLAEDGDKDAEADHDLGRGHHHHEERQHLAVQAAVVGLGEGDEQQVDRVEHQLDAHEHDDGVARISTPTTPMPNSTADSSR